MGTRNTAKKKTYFCFSEDNIIIFHFPWKNSNLSLFVNFMGISYVLSVSILL